MISLNKSLALITQFLLLLWPTTTSAELRPGDPVAHLCWQSQWSFETFVKIFITLPTFPSCFCNSRRRFVIVEHYNLFLVCCQSLPKPYRRNITFFMQSPALTTQNVISNSHPHSLSPHQNPFSQRSLISNLAFRVL